MPKFIKGQAVKQVLPAPVEGVVEGFSIDQEGGNLLVKVTWRDADDHDNARFFREEEIEAVAAPVKATAKG